MASDRRSIEAVRTENELLSCSRALSLEDLGIVVTHRITGRSRSPVKFQVYDPFPGRFTIDDIGFHPDHEPRHGRIDSQMAVISGVVDSEDEVVVRYGLTTAEPLPPEDIEEIHRSKLPSIEIASLADSGEAVDEELETAIASRSASDQVATDSNSPSIFTRWSRRLFGKSEPARRESGESSETEESGEAESPPVSAMPTERTDDSEVTPGLESESGGHTGRESDRDEADGTQGAESMFERMGAKGGDPFGASAANGNLAADIARQASSVSAQEDDEAASDDAVGVGEPVPTVEAARGEVAEETTDSAPDRAGESVNEQPSRSDTDAVGDGKPFTTRLVEQLETNELTPEQRERLAEQLAEIVISQDPALASVAERLELLEKMMASYEPLLDQMEATIDEHGTGERVLERFNSEITSISARLQAIDERIIQNEENREHLRSRIERSAGDFERVESQLGELENRLESLLETHRSRSDRIKRHSTELRSTLETVPELFDTTAHLSELSSSHHETFDKLHRVFAEDSRD